MPSKPPAKPHLTHAQIIRIPRLLDMLYKPSELSEEISVSLDTIYGSYIPNGLPHTKDENGRIWIHGLACAAWMRALTREKTRRQSMPEGYAWCLRCRRPVAFESNRTRHLSKSLTLMQGVCPHCARAINRLQSRKSPSPNRALRFEEGTGEGL